MEYLKYCNKYVSGDLSNSDYSFDLADKKVIVIGGGDTGSDCVGNSNRLGAASVVQIELLGQPPLSRSIDNPWPQWPMTLKTSSSHEEGCEREWAVLTKRFISRDNQNVSGIETVRVEWTKNNHGSYEMNEIPGSEEYIDADYIFLAMGFLHPLKEGLLDQLKVPLDERGNVHATDYYTGVQKIFTAGDMRRGQSLVVWAIEEGRSCAEKVHSYLTAST